MIKIIFLINIYFQMSTIFCIFLLFYSINVMEAKPQGLEAGEPDLEAVFRLEDELEASPFLLVEPKSQLFSKHCGVWHPITTGSNSHSLYWTK